MSGEVLARGVFVQGVCPGVYVLGDFVWGIFVLIPSKTFLSCYFKVFKYGTMDLEHLYPVNNMIRLRLNANLPAVKALIQTASY